MKYMRYILLVLACMCSLRNIKAYVQANRTGLFNKWNESFYFLYHHTKSAYLFDGAFDCYSHNVQEIESFYTSHSTHVTVLMNHRGKKFIVKQGTKNLLIRHLRVAKDQLGAEIAQLGNIAANAVVIIPAHCTFPGKLVTALPATLHEFVPGVSVRSLPNNSWAWVFIHQRLRVNTPKEKRGLTREVIRNMSRHEDLCKMVALDTFIANTDRHKGNFFYDERSNRFTAIDLEHSFGVDLAQYACISIQIFLDGNTEKLSKQEFKGLCIYRDTLKTLMKLYTPQSMYTKLVDFSKEGGILLKPFQSEVAKKLKQYEVSIHKNYASCQVLVVLLDRLIKQYSN